MKKSFAVILIMILTLVFTQLTIHADLKDGLNTYDELALLEQINNLASTSELEKIIISNADAIGIDLSSYDKLSSSNKSVVLKNLSSREYQSLNEFNSCFNSEIKKASDSHSGSGSSGGGSSGSSRPGTITSVTSVRNYSIDPVSYENGLITANVLVSNNFTENNTLFAAIYEADSKQLITVEEVDYMKYYTINGYRRFTWQIPCSANTDIIIRLIGFLSMDTLKPIPEWYTIYEYD